MLTPNYNTTIDLTFHLIYPHLQAFSPTIKYALLCNRILVHFLGRVTIHNIITADTVKCMYM